MMAHELFHYYRDKVGQLGDDMWHEELVANTLAVAYCALYEPEALSSGLGFAERVLARPELALSENAAQVLGDLLDPSRAARPGTYGLPLQQTAVVQLHLIRELACAPERLQIAMQRLLGVREAAA